MHAARWTLIAALAAGLVSACATSQPSTEGAAGSLAATPSSFGQRDLTPPEKKVITDAVATSVRDAASAKYHWTKLSTAPGEDGSVNYCATVDAKSPYAAYDGHQAYIVEVKLSFGRVTSAVMGLIAGGKDLVLVSKMCAKYGLDPNGPV